MSPATVPRLKAINTHAYNESIRHSEAQTESFAWADNHNRRFTPEENAKGKEEAQK